jgi:hypothetical protein
VRGGSYLMILGRDEPGLRRSWHTLHSDWMLTVSVPGPLCEDESEAWEHRTVAMSRVEDDLRYTVHVTLPN